MKYLIGTKINWLLNGTINTRFNNLTNIILTESMEQRTTEVKAELLVETIVVYCHTFLIRNNDTNYYANQKDTEGEKTSSVIGCSDEQKRGK